VGGSINIVSNQPKLQEFGANAEATFGTFAQRRYTGMVNIPVGETLAFRFAGMSEVHDPYYTNGGPLYDIPAAENADSYAFRAMMKWQPSKAFSALLAYDYTAERGTGYLGANMQAPLTLEDDLDTDDYRDDIATPYDINSIKNPRNVYYRGSNPSVDLKHQGARLELSYDTGPVIIEASGSYRDLRYDQLNGSNGGAIYPGYPYDTTNPDNYGTNFWHTNSRSTIAELRLVAPDTARLRWTLGGFFFNEEQYAFLGQTSDPANGFGGGEFNMPDVHGSSIAGYADATFDATESWRVLGGARVTHENKSRKGGLWALWSGFGNGGRFSTEGFAYANENRTIFTLSPTSTVSDRVNGFLNGIKSFGARDEVPQMLCNDPPTAEMGQAQAARVIPNGLGGMQCAYGVKQALLDQERDFNNGVEGVGKPFDVNMIPQNDEVSNNFFDWRIGTEFDLGKDSMIYATVSTGHKAGGFNDTIRGPDGAPQNPPQYTPESVLAFEVGTKNMLADRRIRLNASAFYYKYNDQVFQTIVTVNPDDPTTMDTNESSSIAVRQNAANSNVLGLDVDFNYSLPFGLEAELHALLLDARFGDGTVVNDSRIGFDVSQYKVDISGNWLPRASPLTLNYALSQFLPTGAGIFHWLISGQTVGKHFMSVYNGEGNLIQPVGGDAAIPMGPGPDGESGTADDEPLQSYSDLARPNGAARLTDVVDIYTRFDLGAGWKHPDGRLSIDGFINNAFNIAYATSIISNPSLNLRFYNPPRTAGVRVRVDW
ncbi:MAG TPA: TonB-dependent receptor, partial [Polyangiaceae bacterium]|nr:TonB-dependent receptor [Polyangiaceae bacterium]